MDAKGIGKGEAMDAQGIAMDRLWMCKGKAKDWLWIGYGCERDRQGIAMDWLWIGYGCKRDRRWMRKGEARDAACRFIDSQTHRFTFSHFHTKICVPLFAIIYII